MMYFWSGYFGAVSSRMSIICEVPVMTMSQSPVDTDSRLVRHCAGLSASAWMFWIVWPAASIMSMPRAASSKNPWSPSGPLMTLTTEMPSPPSSGAASDVVGSSDGESPPPQAARASAATKATDMPRAVLFLMLCSFFARSRAGGLVADWTVSSSFLLVARSWWCSVATHGGLDGFTPGHTGGRTERPDGDRRGVHGPAGGLDEGHLAAQRVRERPDEGVSRAGRVDDVDPRCGDLGEHAVPHER